ncbi:MAG: hypothetical protein PHW76_08215 [Alphaproteobacteria bacterium]|nr:hypothetical protein [Alphaproteobacteria bacterium]
MLPPPAKAILLYAADGLSVWKSDFTKCGRPRAPSPSRWVPTFRQLIETYEGLRVLQKLAEAGMMAWSCSNDTLDCTRDAFRDVSFRALAIAALEDFAETLPQKRTVFLAETFLKLQPEEPEPTRLAEPEAMPQNKEVVARRPRFRRVRNSSPGPC